MSELQHIADVARMASGEDMFPAEAPACATCERCEEPFEYEAEYRPWDHKPIKRTLCDACEAIEREESDKRWALDEKRRQYESAVGYRGKDDRGSRLAKASLAEYIEGPHNSAAYAKARKWLEAEYKPNLLIVGPIGSGKSYLAACVYNALHTDYEVAYWLNAGSLMARIRRGFADREVAAEAGGIMEAAESVPFLVLDDLGKVHPGKDVSWVEETFYGIVESRYRNELPTIVTTEWKSAPLAERVGASVVSRLEDGAWVAGIKKPAEAYRRTAP